MAQINGTISNGTPPYSIVVRKVGENTGNRCTSGCNNFPIDFTEDSGNGEYYFILTDSSTPNCIVDSRNITGGVSNVNCDVVQPSFAANLVQPTCSGGGYTNAVLQLTSITNAARYKICYNTTSFDCADCSEEDGVISGSSININLSTPTVPTTRAFLLRAYEDDGCSNYKDYFGTIVTPTCSGMESPSFQVQEIQPFCSIDGGGTVQNAVLKVTNITNATRYKICYNSTFTSSCNSSCTTSDGLISGSSVDINITAPAEGLMQNITVRFYNGSTCLYSTDHSFVVYSPKCSENQITFLNLDVQFDSTNLDGAGSPCITNNRGNDYDMYLTINTPGITENGQQAKTKGTNNRNVPNGNDVPNVFITAPINLSCGPGPFYRFQINFSRLRAKYPAINVFSFELFALKILGADTPSFKSIPLQTNLFSGVTMVKKPQGIGCGGVIANPPIYDNTDASRQPCYSSQSATPQPAHYYNSSISGFRKIASFSFNNTTNQLTWTTE